MQTTRTQEELIEIQDHYCEISTDDVDFDIEQIIYRQLKIVDPDNLDVSTYRDIFVPRAHDSGNFRSLVKRISRYGYSSFHTHAEEDQPLDIPVYQNSIIIVQIRPEDPYHFQWPGIWLKKNPDGSCPGTDRYGEFRYVDAHGNPRDTPVVGCKLIYFSAAFHAGTQQHPYIQSFLYDVPPAPLRLTTIDPDIRHPGNGGAELEP